VRILPEPLGDLDRGHGLGAEEDVSGSLEVHGLVSQR
jgi:hypothetical protein